MDGRPQEREADFDAFYLGSRRQVLRQLTAMTADPEQAADVVQEAYARAWQRWARVSRLDNPAAWVRKVAWRLAVSQYRRSLVAARFRHAVATRPDGAGSDPPPEDAIDVRAALARLPAAHRQVLVLHELCGLSVQEVADEAGVPVGTVKSRLSRARAALAALLGPGYLSPDDAATDATLAVGPRAEEEWL